MSDVYQPSVDRPRILVGPRREGAQPDLPGTYGTFVLPSEDPLAGFSKEPIPAAAKGGASITPEAKQPEDHPLAGFSKEPLPEPPKSKERYGAGEAAIHGALEVASFGLTPAIEGLGAAAGPEYQQSQFWHDIAPVVGATKMLHGFLSGHADPEVQKAYERGRQTAQLNEEAAKEQHPWAYIGGQLAGALATPAFGAAKGVTLAGRALRGAGAGTIGGGLYGGGSAISEGQSPAEVAKSAGKSALTGAAFGGGAAGVLGVAGKAGSKAISLIRGQADTDAEAARRIVTSLKSDLERGTPLTSEEVAVGSRAGVPRAIVDVGGERTRALARSAANTSPEARAALTEMTGQRLAEQRPRIANFIRSITGGANAAADSEVLKAAARQANRPAYARAYAAGDRPIWSPELERLVGSPSIIRSIGGAVERGKDRAINDGFGAFRPGVQVTPDGRLLFNRGKTGVPTYPNLQFWDYAQRELRDMASAAERAGRNEEAGALKGLHNQLITELDKQVPEFGRARSGASAFFGAQDALEAGQKFVMSNANIHEASQALQKMSPAERELFARGFASDLSDKIMRSGTDKQSVLNSVFLKSPDAKRRIALALGPQRAKELEMLLRVEAHVDLMRQRLLGSDTVQKAAEMALAGGGVGAFEGIKEGEFNLAHVLTGALLFGGIRHGAKVIDSKVARRVGEMIASDDPTILRRGIQIVSKSPSYVENLRRATGAFARVAGHDIGPEKTLAGAAVLLDKALRGTPAEDQHAADLYDDQMNQ